MLTASLRCLRVAVPRTADLPALRRRLLQLRQSNRTAEAHLRERRRLHRLLQDKKKGRAHTSGATAHAIQLLPRNDALEAAMALSISENRDARTELELVRQLVNCTLLSFASPVDARWDPYDVKPQVFALDTYIALPVFTSIEYVRLFCHRFGFAVRDPSGALWAASDGGGGEAEEVRVAGLLPEGVTRSAWWPSHRDTHQASATEVRVCEAPSGSSPAESHDGNAAATPVSTEDAAKEEASGLDGEAASLLDPSLLFDAMEMEGIGGDATAAATPSPATPKKVSRAKKTKTTSGRGKLRKRGDAGRRTNQRRRRRLHSRRARRHGHSAQSSATPGSASSANSSAAAAQADEEAAAKAAYWQRVAQTAPFAVKQATPLPTFGAFAHPFLIGYFADISTLLHNAAIVPEKVDIVVNPASPIEFVLARAATDRVLHKDQLLHTAYLKVEKELQREFSTFFAAHCPEVVHAASACVPLPLDMDAVDSARRASRTTRSGAGENALQDYRERTRLLREAEYRNGVAYELTILIHSTSLEETFFKIQQAKHQSVLMGHADLDVLPEMAAAPHVREMAQVFYDGAQEGERRTAQQALAAHAQRSDGGRASEPKGSDGGGSVDGQSAVAGGRLMGVFERRGGYRTINVAQPADSYFHDPTNAYTEAHAVFTEELKLKKKQ